MARSATPEALADLLVKAELLADEVKHLSRRMRVLNQQAAQLRGLAAEILESEEDTSDSSSEHR